MRALPLALPDQNRVVVLWRTCKAGSGCSERKNGWHLAEQAREAHPYGMQRLLSQAVWDTDGVRDDLRQYALEHLGQEAAIVVIDESSFPKRPRIAQRGCGRANPDVMSESHAEPDVELVRENRNRGMESKKGRGWEELRNSQT